VRINVSELDITSRGEGMAVDWQRQSRVAVAVPIGNHIRVVRHGSVATDEDVVELEEALFDQLADAIDISIWHPSATR
jgi:hypothetical protein